MRASKAGSGSQGFLGSQFRQRGNHMNNRTLQLIISKLKNVTPYKRIGLLEYGALQELIAVTEGLLQIVEQNQQTPARDWRDDFLAKSDRLMSELMQPDPAFEAFTRASKEHHNAWLINEVEYLNQKTETLRRNRR
jgi:hypothetical protein